jgi:hypothetical protein
MGKKAKPAMIEGHGSEMRVRYPDARVEPRVCSRTKVRRKFCPCAPCRRLRRRKHRSSCACWLCYADRMGEFIDRLGQRTAARHWLWFVTVTFRTPDFPWARGFPMAQSKPSPDFVHKFFSTEDKQRPGMIEWIEREVHARVEYFTADQFGESGGRLHLHFGLSWPGIFEYRWKDLQEMLWKGTGKKGILKKGAGFNRILPWKMDAGFYIGRYIGRDADRCDWDFRVGVQPVRLRAQVGRQVVAISSVPDYSSREIFNECRPTIRGWHR